MPTAKLDGKITITDAGVTFVIAGVVRRFISGEGETMQADSITASVTVPKAEFLALTGQQIIDRVRAEVTAMATKEGAGIREKKFAGLTIS